MKISSKHYAMNGYLRYSEFKNIITISTKKWFRLDRDKYIYLRSGETNRNTWLNDKEDIYVSGLSFNSILIKYLDLPASAPAWPRVSTSDAIGMTEVEELKLITGGEVSKNDDTLDIALQGPTLSHETGRTFLLVVSMACKAIIACTRQLNKIDEESGNGDYGEMLAHGATAIEAAIQENKIPERNPFATFMQISRIVERTVIGAQGGLYSLFFRSVAKAFTNCQSDEQVTAHTWLDALVTANEAIKQFKTPSMGDETLLTVLVAVEIDLTAALINDVDPIDAFGVAVKAAENFHINHKLKRPNPQAHAVGIWMRAAYEGTKLKLIHR